MENPIVLEVLRQVRALVEQEGFGSDELLCMFAAAAALTALGMAHQIRVGTLTCGDVDIMQEGVLLYIDDVPYDHLGHAGLLAIASYRKPHLGLDATRPCDLVFDRPSLLTHKLSDHTFALGAEEANRWMKSVEPLARQAVAGLHAQALQDATVSVNAPAPSHRI